MTTHLNHGHSVSAVQEKNKMPFDHELFSASTQCSQSFSMSADDNQRSLQPALRPCIYIALRCSRCDSVRQAMAELPSQALVACLECGRECSFILLGSGLTSKSLPFHQVHIVEPTRWDPQIDGETNSS
jgi:hypothetical protein